MMHRRTACGFATVLALAAVGLLVPARPASAQWPTPTMKVGWWEAQYNEVGNDTIRLSASFGGIQWPGNYLGTDAVLQIWGIFVVDGEIYPVMPLQEKPAYNIYGKPVKTISVSGPVDFSYLPPGVKIGLALLVWVPGIDQPVEWSKLYILPPPDQGGQGKQ